jgi:hypothetical protein
MERNGVARSVAMKKNIYRRYAIVSDIDLQEAARKIADGTLSSTLTPTPQNPVRQVLEKLVSRLGI